MGVYAGAFIEYLTDALNNIIKCLSANKKHKIVYRVDFQPFIEIVKEFLDTLQIFLFLLKDVVQILGIFLRIANILHLLPFNFMDTLN